MKLRETFISLVGFYKCSIENNVVMCTGIEHTINNDEEEPVADFFRFDVFDMETRTIPSSIAVIFNQVGDKIFFLYKKDKFEVVSITDKLITMTKDGKEYFIERIKVPV